MTGNLDPAQLEAATASAEAEAQKQTSGSDAVQAAVELGADVLTSGVGEVVANAVGATIEGAGIALTVVGEAAGAIITGALDGL